MIHSLRFTCVLDPNVIYPIDIRDFLFWFASYDLFTPKWSNHIFTEWESVMKRKEIPDEEIKKRISKVQRAFPDALVENYEPLVDSLTLPDEKDRHVLAAAIKANANVIVTNNPALLQDGEKIKLIYRDAELRVFIAEADHYKGPFAVKNDNVCPEAKIEDFCLFKYNNQKKRKWHGNKVCWLLTGGILQPWMPNC